MRKRFAIYTSGRKTFEGDRAEKRRLENLIPYFTGRYQFSATSVPRDDIEDVPRHTDVRVHIYTTTVGAHHHALPLRNRHAKMKSGINESIARLYGRLIATTYCRPF